jgi:hypothetical protein
VKDFEAFEITHHTVFQHKSCWLISPIVKIEQSRKLKQCIMDYEHTTFQKKTFQISFRELIRMTIANNQSHETTNRTTLRNSTLNNNHIILDKDRFSSFLGYIGCPTPGVA